jgi:GT2 family glycosyltransferase
MTEKGNPRTAVLILNWNRKEDTAECVQSVLKMRVRRGDVFVVDNGSTDGSSLYLCQLFPMVSIIEHERNFGYAKGNNAAIQQLLRKRYSQFLLLNNDVLVDPYLLHELFRVMEFHNEIGVVGGLNYYYSDPNKIQFSGGLIDWNRGNTYDITKWQLDGKQFASQREVDTVEGSCMLIRSEVFEKIGFFDERYFLNFEETDFCCRAKRHGFKVMSAMRAHLWHKVSISSTERSYLGEYFMARNKILFLWKNCPRSRLVLALSYHFISTLRKSLKSFRAGKYDSFRALVLGLFDGITNKYYEGRMLRMLQ